MTLSVRPARSRTAKPTSNGLVGLLARNVLSGRCGQLRAPVQGVRALTGFGFDKLSRNSEGFASVHLIRSVDAAEGRLGLEIRHARRRPTARERWSRPVDLGH